MNKKLDYNWLRNKYCEELLTAKEIGALCSRSGRTICYHLNKAGIKPRAIKFPRALYKNKEWLEQKYVKEQWSAIKIAKYYNLDKTTLYRNMNKFNIKRRHPVSRIKNNKKQCNTCNKTLSIENFWRRKTSVDEYRHKCKKCMKMDGKLIGMLYRQRPEIKQRRNELRKKYIALIKHTPQYRINDTMSTGIYKALKKQKAGHHWETLVGYTIHDLKTHLEAQFEPWMTWNNWGQISTTKKTWNIDHIQPISSFNITDQHCNDFKQCWSLDNLRPLDALENIQKSNKIL